MRTQTGSDVYEDILKEMSGTYPGVSKGELERIIDSEFRAIRDTMSNREGKVVQLIYLGKFRPTIYNQDYVKGIKYNKRVEECNLGESTDRKDSNG